MPLQQRIEEDVGVCVCVYECVSVVLRDKMRIGLSLDADLATFKLPDRVDVAAEIEVL